LVFRDWSFTDLTSCSVFDPAIENIFAGQSLLEIKQITTNFGVDELELVGIEIFDQSWHVLWVEVDLCP
jgi:hypothetical protein